MKGIKMAIDNILRKYKWASIRGLAGVGAFALSTKLISIPLLNILVGIIAAYTVKNVVKSLRLFEYLNYLARLAQLITQLFN